VSAWPRHNLIYWRSEDWIGIGPGAHGRLTIGSEGPRYAFVQATSPCPQSLLVRAPATYDDRP